MNLPKAKSCHKGKSSRLKKVAQQVLVVVAHHLKISKARESLNDRVLSHSRNKMLAEDARSDVGRLRSISTMRASITRRWSW